MVIEFLPQPKPLKRPKKQKRHMASRSHKPPVSDADRAYMLAVKGLPCCICGSPAPSDAHHPIVGRFGSHKPPARDCIPLCKRHHQDGPDAIHNGKSSWVAKYGDDRDYIEPTRRLIDAEK